MATDAELDAIFAAKSQGVKECLEHNIRIIESEDIEQYEYSEQLLTLAGMQNSVLLGIYEELVEARRDRRIATKTS